MIGRGISYDCWESALIAHYGGTGSCASAQSHNDITDCYTPVYAIAKQDAFSNIAANNFENFRAVTDIMIILCAGGDQLGFKSWTEGPYQHIS